MGGNPKPVVEHEIAANRNPELATAWTKHRAITNYVNVYNIGVDMGRDYITSIERLWRTRRLASTVGHCSTSASRRSRALLLKLLEVLEVLLPYLEYCVVLNGTPLRRPPCTVPRLAL